MRQTVYPLLYSLGLSSNYVGFAYTVTALELILDRPHSLEMVTKWLYPEVARRHNTSWSAVERSIRTLVKLAWERAPEQLERISGCTLRNRPTPTYFLAILAFGLQIPEGREWSLWKSCETVPFCH